MKKLRVLIVFVLFLVINILAIVNASYYDDDLLISDTQIYIKNLNSNLDKVENTADKNNIIIYTKNIFNIEKADNNSEFMLRETNIYTNTKLISSPFYLKDKVRVKYDTFTFNRKTYLNNLNLLDKQDSSDFWVIYKNKNYLDNFIKDLKNNSVDFTLQNIDVSKLQYDYKQEFIIAIYTLILTSLTVNVIYLILSSKDLSLRLIYNSKFKSLSYYLFQSVKLLILSFIINLFLITIVLYFHNNLSRFDIVLDFVIRYSFISFLFILITNMIVILVFLNRIDIIKSIRGFIGDRTIYYLINIISVVSLVCSSHFYSNIQQASDMLNRKIDNNLISGIKKVDDRLDKYKINLAAHQFMFNNNEVDGEYAMRTYKLAIFLQKNYNAEYLIAGPNENAITVNNNYLRTHKLLDENNNVIKANDKTRYKLKDSIEYFDYSDNKVSKANEIFVIKDGEICLSGGIDLTFNKITNLEMFKNEIKQLGIEDICSGVSDVNFDYYYKQIDDAKGIMTNSILSFVFFIMIFITGISLNIKAYLEMNKKKLALMNIYKHNVIEKYRSYLVMSIIIYILAFILARIIYTEIISINLIIMCMLINIIIVIIYSFFIEHHKIKNWLNGA